MKKNRFLKYLSSLIGVFSFIGCFVFGLFLIFKDSNRSIESKAVDVGYNLYTESFSDLYYDVGTQNGYTTRLHYSFNVSLDNVTGTNTSFTEYRFTYNFFSYGELFNDSVSYKYLPTNADTNFVNVIVGDDMDDPVPSGTVINITNSGGGGGRHYNNFLNNFIVRFQLPYLSNNGNGANIGGSGGAWYDSNNEVIPLNDSRITDNLYSSTALIYPPDNVTSYTLVYNSNGAQIEEAYNNGREIGYSQGYTSGSQSGYASGYEVGYNEGVASQAQVIESSYNNGYNVGYNEGFTADSTATTIFSGILQVALVPINFFLSIFNFEILGINLSGFIRALFTIALTIIVIKTVFGGKGASE